MPLAGQFLRYALVGAANTATHVTCLLLLVEAAGWPPLAGNTLAFGVASALSFVLNARFTFGGPLQWPRYPRFLVVASIGLALQALAMHLAQRVGWHYLVGAVAGIAAAVLVGFVLNRRLVFNH